MADEPQDPQLPLTPPGDGSGTPPTGPGAANIVPINIEDEMRRSYLDYSMSVIIGRALPDIRDGLKPVHRRILYAMHDMGLLHNRKHVKCAKVVGEGLGKYHPHGDAALYDALVRMAQPFSLRYPLVDGQGNFGSVDGDPPAAYRYTECRMTAIAEEMLADIDKDTVDFVENFDNTTVEPVVLPTKVPNLLINGSDGIAVGMATKIPPHNLTEIVDATIALINSPQTPLGEILKLVKGPDFPTGAFIHGRSGIAEAYKTGRGRFVMRAKAAIENITRERQAIIVTEIPYQVNKATLIKRIADLVNDKTLDDVSDVRDESDRDGMRIVIELKRGAEPQIILNNLHKHTQMQENFSMIFLAVVNGQPKEMGLIPAIRYFIDHRVDVVRRRTSFLLERAREREHILEGYQIALNNLSEVISIIRMSPTRLDARENLRDWSERKRVTRLTRLNPKKVDDSYLIEPYKYDTDGQGWVAWVELTYRGAATMPTKNLPSLTYKQIDAILDLQLHRLTRMSVMEIVNELAEIRLRIKDLEEILASEKRLRKEIVKELEEIRKNYGDERRTQILDEAAELQLEDLIADEQMAVTFSHSGYLKRTPIATYRSQRRGGSGRIGMRTREEDFVERLIIASTHAYLLVFTNTGRVYWLKVYEVPDVGSAGKGKAINQLVALQPGESVRAILNVRDLDDETKFVFFATRNGTVKKTPLKDFSNVMSRGIIAIGIEQDDELVGAKLTDGQEIVFLASHDGMAIRFDESDVRPMGRPAYGVRGMDLDDTDYVVGMAITPKAGVSAEKLVKGHDFSRAEETAPTEGALAPEGVPASEESGSLILSVTENGYGKRTPVEEYRLQSRGGKGVINVKTTSRNGKVVAILLVSEDTEAMVISQYGKIIRLDTSEIREAGRSTQGVRLLSMEGGDKVAAAVVIPPEERNGNGTLIH